MGGGLDGMVEGQKRGVVVWETPCLRQKYPMRAMPSFVYLPLWSVNQSEPLYSSIMADSSSNRATHFMVCNIL